MYDEDGITNESSASIAQLEGQHAALESLVMLVSTEDFAQLQGCYEWIGLINKL